VVGCYERDNEFLDSVKCRELFWLTEKLLAFQEGLGHMELVS
jgi:hypothetical protein